MQLAGETYSGDNFVTSTRLNLTRTYRRIENNTLNVVECKNRKRYTEVICPPVALSASTDISFVFISHRQDDDHDAEAHDHDAGPDDDGRADDDDYGKISLVFGCIGTDLCKQIRVL